MEKISNEQQFVSINCFNSPFQVAVAGHKDPVQEQVEWFYHIFEETAMYYEFKDFDILQENKFEKVT